MTQPRTRDLRKVIDALDIVEAELRFQVNRLKGKSKNDLERRGERDEFLERLCKRYDEATGTIVTLKRYHEGRIGAIPPRPDTDFPDDVNSGGVATAYTDDDE
jgi:hypothetical protein